MSYIQIKDFGGKDRGLKFNQIAFNINSEYMGDTQAESLYAMFYGGLVGNSKVKREEIDYTYEDVTEWVDKLIKENRKDIFDAVAKVLSEELTAYTKVLPAEGKEQKKSKQLRKAS